MTVKLSTTPETETATVELSATDWQLRTTVSVPTGPMELYAMLPLVQTLADAVVHAAAKSVEDNGEKISCQKSCGACCRQLVPISGVEARHIRQLVDDLPAPRQSEIRRRFAEARRQLERTDLLEKLTRREQWSDDEVPSLGLKYFLQGISCPFLEDESCSIYADRPIACREYLVTSPAQNCVQPDAESIKQVTIPFKFWPALARFEKSAAGGRFIPWVPLILALDSMAHSNPEISPRAGTELLRELFENLSQDKQTLERNAHATVDKFPSSIDEPEQDSTHFRQWNGAGKHRISRSAAETSEQEVPLRFGATEDFARVRSSLQAAGYDDATICRIFAIEQMSDVDAAKKQKAGLTGLLGLFTKLFLFLESLPCAEVERLVDVELLGSLTRLDLIRVGNFSAETGNEAVYYSPVWLYPVEGLLIASDRRINPDGSEFSDMPDIVFPAIYAGTLRFLRVFSKYPAAEALDLGSGSGIAALVLSKTVGRVVASDITARAKHFAQFNCALNDRTHVDVVRGDLYGSVDGRSFDRIVAHPPYVPSTAEALIYRDSGESGETLIRRIIAGLPAHLRAGGTFYSVCEAWDSQHGSFEERVRHWLGEQESEFDVIFALEREISPEEVAHQVVQLKHADKDAQAMNWLRQFRDAGLVRRVYGAIVIHRRAAKIENAGPFTKRLRLGDATDGSCFEWALRWYDWRRENEANGQFEDRLRSMKPRLSPHLKAKVTQIVQNGSLTPADVVLEVDKPFPTASRVDFWMMQMLAGFNGQATPTQVYQAAREQLAFPDAFALKDFISLVANMIERGCLEVDIQWLEG